LENKLIISADLPFSSFLVFFCGRARAFSGLVPGLLVFCLDSLSGRLEAGSCDWALESVLFLRRGLGEAGVSSLLWGGAAAEEAGSALGEEKRKFFSVFLAVGLGASSSSLSESSTTLRLRRFDGGAIAGDEWPGEHLFAGSVMWWPTVGDLVVVLDLGRHGPDCEVGLTS
jgi:hypothetical protein